MAAPSSPDPGLEAQREAPPLWDEFSLIFYLLYSPHSPCAWQYANTATTLKLEDESNQIHFHRIHLTGQVLL